MRAWFGLHAVVLLLSAGTGLAGATSPPEMQMGGKCSPDENSLSITARDSKFDKDCLAVDANVMFAIKFDNQDRLAHGVAILPSHGSTQPLFSADVIDGPKRVTYVVPPLEAGTYHFHCEVHPELMQGTFVVVGAMTGKPAMPAMAPHAAMRHTTALPHSGPRRADLLLLLAGIALAAGGLAIIGGARRA
jgi:plastocyanin